MIEVASQSSIIVEMKSKKSNEHIPSSKKIEAFWNWFLSTAETLADLLERSSTKEIADLIEPRIKSLSDKIGWEIGPGLVKRYGFAISLNGSISNVPSALVIVAAAPVLAGWEFYCGLPPKKWDGRFRLKNRTGQTVSLDCSSWRYVLTGYDDNKFFDITALAQMRDLDNKAKIQAVKIALRNILGERVMLERLDRIEVRDSTDPNLQENASALMDLGRHIEFIDVADTSADE